MLFFDTRIFGKTCHYTLTRRDPISLLSCVIEGRYVGRSSIPSILADLDGRGGKGKILGRKAPVVIASTAIVFAFVQDE